MEFWIQKGNDKIQLPVKPSDYEVTVASKNTVVNVIQLGDINLRGKTGLRDITLSSFFPAKDYNFSNNSDRKEPMEYVKKLDSWRKSDDPIRVIITDTLNMEATIESFAYGERDATRDIYYSLQLKEYKKPKVSSSSTKTTGAKTTKTKKPTTTNTTTRTVTKPTTNLNTKYTVKAGDCLWKIAKQFYGDGEQYTKIYNANRDKLDNPHAIDVGQVLIIP
jgi:nucleoid-associated protein YgaU